MGDVGDDFRAMRAYKKQKKENNQSFSTDILEIEGVNFTSKNYGNHLIIDSAKGVIDFWPSTGKWIVRRGKTGRGIKSLLSYINKKAPN